jgi:1,2-phenylacetyl-CoA epoxidase catalytic subunit
MTAIQAFQAYTDKFGRIFHDMAMTVYVNFYQSELEIMDLCARWIPRRSDFAEKSYLIRHASDEVEHAKLFKSGVIRLGVTWDQELFDRYRIRDIDDRFSALHRSEDELRVLVGLNCYAEGVLAMEELVQLGRNLPDIFPDFDRIARDEGVHVAFGKTVLKRMMADQPSRRVEVQRLVDEYRDHILEYLWGELGDKIELGIHFGGLPRTYREHTLARFTDVMTDIGCEVTWPRDRRPIATM